MQRILHVLGRTDRGGTESMLMTHYRHVDRSQLQFDFVVHTEDKCDFDSEIEALGGRIFRLRRFNVLNYFQYQCDWTRFLSSHPEYEVIHIHHFLVAGIILPIAAKMGVKVRIVHSHNTKPPIFLLKEKVMWLFHRDLIKYSTKRLACSVAAGNYLFGMHSFDVFNNAIETEKFRFDANARNQVRKELGLEANAFVVGHIGSFRTKQKNQEFIIDIFNEVIQINSNASLVLVGDGILKKEIEKKIESLGLSASCVLTGIRNDVPRLLSAFDVFVFPSLFEGLGIVSVEAQCAGLPVFQSEDVAEDSCLTPLCQRISRECPPKEWARQICQAQQVDNRNTFVELVTAQGYDVLSNVQKLKKIYEL